MQKQPHTGDVHFIRLGERQRLSDEASESLAQRIVPSFHRRSHSRLLTCRRVLCGRDNEAVRFPKVAVTMRAMIGGRNPRPELLTHGGASVANIVRRKVVTKLLNDGHTYREVQMVTKHKDPKTIQRYDHARENLDHSPVNSLSWDE